MPLRMKKELRESYDRAGEFMDAGDLTAAKSILLDLSIQDPSSPAILAVLGNVNWKMGKLEEAAAIFRRATELRPKLEAVSLGLFYCLWDLGKRVEAMEELKRFQTISDSQNYREIVKEINEKWQKLERR
jgi:predicted Zn-dependent protease